MLTEKERWTAINALYVAAEEYEKHSKQESLSPRLRETFARQVEEAKAIAAKLEEME